MEVKVSPITSLVFPESLDFMGGLEDIAKTCGLWGNEGLKSCLVKDLQLQDKGSTQRVRRPLACKITLK